MYTDLLKQNNLKMKCLHRKIGFYYTCVTHMHTRTHTHTHTHIYIYKINKYRVDLYI